MSIDFAPDIPQLGSLVERQRSSGGLQRLGLDRYPWGHPQICFGPLEV